MTVTSCGINRPSCIRVRGTFQATVALAVSSAVDRLLPGPTAPLGSVGPHADDHFKDHAESRFKLLLCLEAQLLNLLG